MGWLHFQFSSVLTHYTAVGWSETAQGSHLSSSLVCCYEGDMLEAFPQAVYLKKPLFSWGTDYPDDSVPLCVPQICWAISARHHRSCKAAQPKDTLPKAEVITKVRTELQKALHRNTWLSLANSHTSATTATLQPRLQDPEVQESHYISLAPWLDWNSICSLV